MMKTKHLTLILINLLISFPMLHAENNYFADTTGLPGDNFSLQAALEMFKKSSTIEEFEKLINDPDNHVSDLDLNNDNEVDYIRVIDKTEGDLHAFILQIPVSDNEDQDVAVIELEKTGKNKAMVQIVGDEEIFGEQIIVEPSNDDNSDETMDKPKKGGPNSNYSLHEDDAVVINVWGWPSVRFVYGPAYTPWLSPWRWGLYPAYWRPWRPLGWRAFHPLHVRYHRAYVVTPKHRVVRVHKMYAPVRVSSVSVRTRHAPAVKNYQMTRTKTTVTGPRGNVKVTKTKTKVRRR